MVNLTNKHEELSTYFGAGVGGSKQGKCVSAGKSGTLCQLHFSGNPASELNFDQSHGSTTAPVIVDVRIRYINACIIWSAARHPELRVQLYPSFEKSDQTSSDCLGPVMRRSHWWASSFTVITIERHKVSNIPHITASGARNDLDRHITIARFLSPFNQELSTMHSVLRVCCDRIVIFPAFRQGAKLAPPHHCAMHYVVSHRGVVDGPVTELLNRKGLCPVHVPVRKPGPILFVIVNGELIGALARLPRIGEDILLTPFRFGFLHRVAAGDKLDFGRKEADIVGTVLRLCGLDARAKGLGRIVDG